MPYPNRLLVAFLGWVFPPAIVICASQANLLPPLETPRKFCPQFCDFSSSSSSVVKWTTYHGLDWINICSNSPILIELTPSFAYNNSISRPLTRACTAHEGT